MIAVSFGRRSTITSTTTTTSFLYGCTTSSHIIINNNNNNIYKKVRYCTTTRTGTRLSLLLLLRYYRNNKYKYIHNPLSVVLTSTVTVFVALISCTAALSTCSSTYALIGNTCPKSLCTSLGEESIISKRHQTTPLSMTTMKSSFDHNNNNNNHDTNSSNIYNVGYLNAKDAAALDAELMSTPGYTLEQLMELAGLAVVEAVYQIIQEQEQQKQGTLSPRTSPITTTIYILCGPGNNGGDGLVAARHLYMFGYTNITIVYPSLQKGNKHVHYTNLIQQCIDLNIPIVERLDDDWWLSTTTTEQQQLQNGNTIIIDAIFGFSFSGGVPRPPYDTLIDQLLRISNNYSYDNDRITTIAVDVPSGWNVDGDDDGNNSNIGYIPDVLISLTAPKLCAKLFTSSFLPTNKRQRRHYIGGRFLPPLLAQKYNISMPPYPGVSQVMEVSIPPDPIDSASTLLSSKMDDQRSWEVEYANYLIEKETSEKHNQQLTETTDEGTTWEEQYAAYCAEKEAKLLLSDKNEEDE